MAHKDRTYPEGLPKPKTHPILEAELKKSNIDEKELAYYLHDGREEYNRNAWTAKIYAEDPAVKFSYAYYDMDREEVFESNLQRLARLKEITKENNLPEVTYVDYEDYGPPLNTLMSTSLHHGMFETVLRILGSEEQVKEYLPKVTSYEILGCYTQTEMGHGSDVQSLMTEAVYDRENDQFVVNTPSIKATKFWPGELGKLANYCVFHAKMIIDGESYGVHAFLAQIRDMETHRPLKGLEIGDVGPKYGYLNKDNGYMIFTDFKLPRTALLSRFVSLDKKGMLNIQGDPKVAYSTMLYVRISLVNFTWKLAISTCLIALRYSLFRTQFKTVSNSEQERRIFDYQATQHQIIPFLAYAYATTFSAKQCAQKYEIMREEIKNDKFTTMKDLHSIAAAFKALQMQESLDGFFKAREVCGAHGYSNYSNIPNIIELWSPNVTLEGDSMVMYQQTARGFIKSFRLVEQHGKQLKGIYSYLNEYKGFIGFKDHSKEFKDNEELLKLLKAATVLSIHKVSHLLPEIDDEINYDIQWNKVYQIDIISASLLNAHFLVAMMFQQELKIRDLSKNLKSVLYKTLDLYICDVLIKFGQELLYSDYITPTQWLGFKTLKDELIESIKPHAYKLANSFMVNDILLHSKLALPQGKVYEEMYKTAANNKLNAKTKLESFDEHLKPLRRRLIGQAKL